MKKYIFVTRKTIYSASYARTHHQSKSETLIMASSMWSQLYSFYSGENGNFSFFSLFQNVY